MKPNSAARRDSLMPDLCYRIINAFFEVYNWLGFGFLESLYAKALEIALRARGPRVDREVPIPVYFREHLIGTHRIDMLVEGKIIVELKSSEHLSGVALRQTRNYLAAANLELGLVLHFGKHASFYRVLTQKRPTCELRYSSNGPNSDG